MLSIEIHIYVNYDVLRSHSIIYCKLLVRYMIKSWNYEKYVILISHDKNTIYAGITLKVDNPFTFSAKSYFDAPLCTQMKVKANKMNIESS